MRSRKLTLLLIVQLISVSCEAKESDYNVLRLVKAMEVERVLQLQLTQMASSPVQAVCINSKSKGVFSEAIADALTNELSSSEALFLAEFYESSAGRKYSQKAIFNISKSLGVPTTLEMPTYSQEEEKVIAQFAESEAGKKLLFGSALKAMLRVVASKTYQIGFDCSHYGVR